MEKKTNYKSGMEMKALWALKSLLCAYVVTGILLLLLTFLLYKFGLGEDKVTAGIIVIYIVSAFAGGFAAGKMAKFKKFLWGLAMGVLYFLLLVVITLGIYHTLQDDGIHLLITFLLCAGGGMLGGMLS